jgi:hypothetical protein
LKTGRFHILLYFSLITTYFNCFYLPNNGYNISNRSEDQPKFIIKYNDKRCYKSKNDPNFKKLLGYKFVTFDCDENERNETTERIQDKLNSKLNNYSNKIIYVNIDFMYADDALDPNSQKLNEPMLDFMARTLPFFTLYILPGWILVQDEYHYEFFYEDRKILKFKDFNSGYIVGSLFALPYIFFRTSEDTIVDHINFVILNQYAIYELNKEAY